MNIVLESIVMKWYPPTDKKTKSSNLNPRKLWKTVAKNKITQRNWNSNLTAFINISVRIGYKFRAEAEGKATKVSGRADGWGVVPGRRVTPFVVWKNLSVFYNFHIITLLSFVPFTYLLKHSLSVQLHWTNNQPPDDETKRILSRIYTSGRNSKGL